MDDSQGRRVIDCAKCTVEYESHQGKDSVLLVPFPDGETGDSVILKGTADDITAVLEGIAAMIESGTGSNMEWDG